jgi:ATP-binding cassette subfamily B protein
MDQPKTPHPKRRLQLAEFKRFWRNVRRTFAYGWRIDRASMFRYSIGIVLQVASSLLAAYFGARVINALIGYIGTEGASTAPVFTNLGLSAGLALTEQLAWRYLSYAQNRSYLIWHTQISPELTGKVAGLDIQRFEDSEFNKLINKVSQDYNWKPADFMSQCYNILHGMIRMVSTSIVLISFAPWLVLLLLLGVIPSLLVEQKQSKIKWDIWHVKGDASRRYHKINWMMQNKQDISDIRLFGLRGYLSDYCRRMLTDFNDEQQGALRRFIRPAMLARLFEGGLVTGVQVWLVLRVLAKNGFSIGQYTFYSGMMFQFNSSVGVTLASLTRALENNRYMTDFYEFLDTPTLLPVPENPIVLDPNDVPEIRLENVSFHYPSSKKYVFKNMDLTIKPGERVALVGENGVGKSTLIKLLLRFYDVTEGRITVNGHDLRDLDLASWYSMIGVLFQDFSRYPFSVHDNIWMGRIQKPADPKEIERAARLAGFHHIAKDLPRGYETVLDNSFDEGVEPSGGQWQRVALARAFYRAAPVLILDEPTAAIDSKAEYEIFNNIFAENDGHSALIVSHRFSTVRKADRILVFKKGKLHEHGTHEELMKNHDLYFEMFSKQAEGYL